MFKLNRDRSPMAAVFFCYLVFSALTLDFFPFMHSDEAWLASFARGMLHGRGWSVTEDFLTLGPAYTHAFKLFYFLLEIPFLFIRESLTAIRFLSWFCGAFTLVFVFRTACRWMPSRKAFYLTIFWAMDLQFLYCSHLARQEIVLLLVFAAALFVYGGSYKLKRKALVLGVLIGLGIGVHPNSFLLFCPFSLILLLDSLEQKEERGVFWIFLGTVSFFFLLFIGVSFLMDSDFLSGFLAFGTRQGVGGSLWMKGRRYLRFYQKIFFQIEGTYYLPPLRISLIVLALGYPFSVVVFLRKSCRRPLLLRLWLLQCGMQGGLFLLGKYSPPSVVFILFSAFFIFLINFDFILSRLTSISRRGTVVFIAALLLAFSATNVYEIMQWKDASYQAFINRIESIVPRNAQVLGNLNTAFAFDYDRLHAFRDLEYLPREPEALRRFLREEEIEYVLVPGELEIIHRERPVWNDLYGNIFFWYGELQTILEEDALLVASFSEPVYGLRIGYYRETPRAERIDLRIYRMESSAAD